MVNKLPIGEIVIEGVMNGWIVTFTLYPLDGSEPHKEAYIYDENNAEEMFGHLKEAIDWNNEERAAKPPKGFKPVLVKDEPKE